MAHTRKEVTAETATTITVEHEYITLTEIAGLLRSSKRYAKRQLDKVGAPPAYTAGSWPLWRRSEIDAWIESTAQHPREMAGCAETLPRARGPQRRSR